MLQDVQQLAAILKPLTVEMTNTDYLTTVPQTRNTQGQLKEQSVKGIHQALTLVKMMLRWVF